MAKTQLNARVSDLTKQQLEELGSRWGTTQTETLTVIIDRMFQQEIAAMTTPTTTTQKVTVTNPTRTRKWGWGWTNTPTGRDAYSIEIPSAPDYTGTLKQVSEAIANDRTYASMKSGGTFTNTAWFYDGKRILNRDEFRNWLDWDSTASITIEVEIN